MTSTMFVLTHGRPLPTRSVPPILTPIICADGTKVSAQASAFHYCSPRNNEGPWDSVEVWFPGDKEPRGWVPIAELRTYIESHGGER